MPFLRPFRALRYAATDSADLSRLICPPYDVISPDQRARLVAADAHNAVHLELPDSYPAAADTFADWLARGVLARDGRAAIYPYSERFAADDGPRTAHGFFCLLRLEPYGPDSGVRAHEATMGAPKEDRFRLLTAVRTNLSPVLLLYESADGGAASAELFARLTAPPPVGHALDEQGDEHTLWASDPTASADAAALLELAGGSPLTIADGHHRYETALRYAQQPGAPRGSQFVLALLYDARSGGLALRPWHRLVHGIASEQLRARLDEFYLVEPASDGQRLADAVRHAGQGTLGLWTPEGGYRLTVRRPQVAPLLDPNASETLRWLDVSVLSVTLSAMIGSTGQTVGDTQLSYTSDAGQAIAAVRSGDAAACFLVAPTPVEAVLEVAAAGEHMPPKSTYFQPKAATGLVFNPLFD